MKTKVLSLIIICFITFGAFSQTNLNNYKYVIVPNKFDFLKEADQYQLNSLTEFLFNKYGFLALMEGSNYPDDAVRNRCLVLKSNLLKDGSMFKTKLAIELKDCNDQVVFTSEMGESREKVFQKAYNEALRNAFASLEGIEYEYVPSTNVETAVTQKVENNRETSNEIEQLKEEIQNLKKEKQVAVAEVTKPMVNISPAIPLKEIANNKEVVENRSTGVLYAQAIENGFQLVDSSPKVVYRIKQTSIPNVFLVENKNATLSKKDNNWVLEYYENNVLKQKILDIKF